MFKTSPLPGRFNFGVTVEDLRQDDIEDPQICKALFDLWIDRGLLLFRNMEGGRDFHFRLSKVFGDLELHPVVTARLPEQPEITPLHYKPGEGATFDVDGEERGAYLPWHSDLIYHDRINRGGLLRAIQVPEHGGHTGYIDQIELYETLPHDLKQRVDGLNVIYNFDPGIKTFGKPYLMISGSRRTVEPGDYPYVAHPMVFTQVETGRKVLNVSPWFPTAIEGMDADESDELLTRIVEHCEDESRAYFHHWRPSDMVLWDNWRMLHSAYGVPPDETRWLERTTLKGDYELGRVVRPARSKEEVIPVDV